MSEVEQEQQPGRNINLPIQWHIPEDVQSRYVTNVLVQPGPNEIFISLFEARLPILTGTPEENSAELERLGSVKAECVGRIIVAPDTVPGIINALQVGLESYRVSKEAQERSNK